MSSPRGHHAGPGAVTQFTHQRHAGTDLAEFLELPLEGRAHGNLQLRGQAPVALSWMAANTSSCEPRSADSMSFSSLSVMLGDGPSARSARGHPSPARARVICAMLRQLASEETLVPTELQNDPLRKIARHDAMPRLRTRAKRTACGGPRVQVLRMLVGIGLRRTLSCEQDAAPRRGTPCRSRPHGLLLGIEEMSRRSFSSLRSASTSSSLLSRGFAAFCPECVRVCPRGSRNTVVVGAVFGCVVEEFVVQIEVFVIAL